MYFQPPCCFNGTIVITFILVLPMSDKHLTATLRIEGGSADQGLLDIYDAANTIYGLARAVNLVGHAFANDEVVRTKAQNAHGMHAYIRASTKGCFEEHVDVFFENKTVIHFGRSVINGIFWDYLTTCWSSAIGVESEVTTPYVAKVLRKNELFRYEISDALEVPMQLLHKCIAKDDKVKIYLSRPKVGDILTFNRQSLDYVSVREEREESFEILGNVTRFNVLSDFGRLYSDQDGRVISFRLDEKSAEKLKSKAVESMQEVADGKDGKRNFLVSPVVSAQGNVKKYVLHSIKKA